MGENVGTLFILNEIGISVRMVYNISNFVIERKGGQAMNQYMKSYRNAISYKAKSILPQKVALVLGSDWAIMRMISVWQTLDYPRHRGFPVSTVPGHKGRLSSDMSEKFRWCACREEFIIMKDMTCRMLCFRRV